MRSALAAHETPMVQEEPQQIQVRAAQVAAQCEVVAQSRVEVFDQRTAARGLRHDPADGVEQGVELVAKLRPQPAPSLPIGGRGAGQAVQHAGLAHEGLGDDVGLRDGGQFLVEHAGEGEQIITLVPQRDAHRADTPHILRLQTRQFIDDEVEQLLPRGQAGPASARTSWLSHWVSVRMSRANPCAWVSACRASASSAASASFGAS